jgi:hypothetical protein
VFQLLDLRFELSDGLFEIQEGNGHVVFTEISGWREVTVAQTGEQTAEAPGAHPQKGLR